jgi:ATP adenylyltransferase
MAYHDSACVFCKKFGNESSHEPRFVFDKIIWENSDFVIVPALGSLVPGYLLIITRQHHLSFTLLSSKLLGDLMKIKSIVRQVLTTYFMPPVFFEHGMACDLKRTGGCIDHAHLHCVPLPTDLVSRLVREHDLIRLQSTDELVTMVGTDRSYVYLENQKQEQFVLLDPDVPSQYLRRLVAESVGMREQWDWGVFFFEQNIADTLEVMATAETELNEALGAV